MNKMYTKQLNINMLIQYYLNFKKYFVKNYFN